jgi:uncharacterized protein YueI
MPKRREKFVRYRTEESYSTDVSQIKPNIEETPTKRSKTTTTNEKSRKYSDAELELYLEIALAKVNRFAVECEEAFAEKPQKERKPILKIPKKEKTPEIPVVIDAEHAVEQVEIALLYDLYHPEKEEK